MTITSRLLVVTASVLLAGAYLAKVSRAEPVPIRESLVACPVEISDWSGRHAPDFDEKTLAVLGVSEYLNRVYQNPRGNPVSLYIGYYGSQRQGDTMHSPLNCLPGADGRRCRSSGSTCWFRPTPLRRRGRPNSRSRSKSTNT